MDELKYVAISIVSMPLLASAIIGLFNKHIPRMVASWVACIAIAVSMLASIWMLFGFLLERYTVWDNNLYIWGQSGNLQVTVGFLLDRLSAIMVAVVTFVSFAVHVYTVGYMHDDDGYQRFFCYTLLFTFAMLMLVMANNFAQLFFGWEGVGLLSYLLIGFWFKKPTANFASLKAFLINRFGDAGFILGIAAILYYFNTLQYAEIFSKTTAFMAYNHTLTILPNLTLPVMDIICLSLFIGAMAKSAQIPLHVWLPDSMEGPTPISALIHAATMVTAGIYMVARLSPIFEYSEATLIFMTIIGSITCISMSILAIVQRDIKRIIAYSTISQLGYMVVALGVSAYAAAIFHLVTHAFFKALLFLGAGSVILALHHEQDIFNMGNLRKLMPITTAMMLIGTLSMIGFPGFAGFYSKDLIIAAAKNSQVISHQLAYYATLGTVLFTTIYSFRLLFLVFFSKSRETNDVSDHIHESPKIIWMPLVLLAIPAVVSGAVLINYVLNDLFQSTLFVLPGHDVLLQYKQNEYHGIFGMLLHGFFAWPFLLIILGFVISWLCYIRYPFIPLIIQRYTKLLYEILQAKYGFDALNEKLIVPMVKRLGNIFWIIGDVICIDGIMVNGTANSINRVAGIIRKIQTGYLYHYVFMMIIGLVALLVWNLYL